MAIQEKMYRFYRTHGMTHAGACAMLSACQHEGAFRSNNLEDRGNKMWRISDEEYTRQIVAGVRDFIDDCGYGFFQWTYHTRKQGLLSFAVMLGVSIDNEDMQLQYSICELKDEAEFHNCWVCLCSCDNVDTCAEIVTREYERPAGMERAVRERQETAKAWADKFRNLSLDNQDLPAAPDKPLIHVQPPFKYQSVQMPLLGFEREGPGVITLQGALLLRGFVPGKDAIGYFGAGTKEAVENYQRSVGLPPDGMCGKDTYTELIKMR